MTQKIMMLENLNFQCIVSITHRCTLEKDILLHITTRVIMCKAIKKFLY